MLHRGGAEKGNIEALICNTVILAGWLLTASTAHAEITLLLEEPYGAFGMTPTGHAAISLK
jgi:hypothetical protein